MDEEVATVRLTEENLQAIYQFYQSQPLAHKLTIATTLFLIGCHFDGINWDHSDINCQFIVEINKREGGEE